MRLQFDRVGNWIIDPCELASKLGISVRRLRLLQSLRLVVCRHEKGQGANDGRSRMTVRTEDGGWEGVFNQQGVLINERRLCGKEGPGAPMQRRQSSINLLDEA